MNRGTEAMKRARDLERAGRLGEALEAYREAAAADPSAGEPCIRIVGLHLLQGRHEEAEREAREFVGSRANSEAHATLGQVLRLRGRHDEAVDSFAKALSLDPESRGLRVLLNEARRGRYWAPSAEAWTALAAKSKDGSASPRDLVRWMHLRFLGLVSSEIHRWISAADDREELPPAILADLDRRFDGRFGRELSETASLAQRLAEGGPLSPAAAKVVTIDDGTVEGRFADTDSLLAGSLEAIVDDRYDVISFGELRSFEVVEAGPWFRVRLSFRDGRTPEALVPALYLLTESCRHADAREGRVTLWRYFTEKFRVGLGLRDFELVSSADRKLLGFTSVQRVEFA